MFSYLYIMYNCKIVNIVWIDRGILLIIIYYIIKYYNKLIYKNIIIQNKNYRNILSLLFFKLKFKKFTKHRKNNFYFNIRQTIYNKNIFINYIKNYEYVNANKIRLIPWYDSNDPIISFRYNKNRKLYINDDINYIRSFSLCKRANINNTYWDIYIEHLIFNKYYQLFGINIYSIFNNYLLSEYIYSNLYNKFEYPRIYYNEKSLVNIESDKKKSDNNILKIDNDNFNLLIELFNKKIDIINNILY